MSRPFDGDSAVLPFGGAKRAETGYAGCGPAATYHVVYRPHAFTAPHDAIDLAGILREIRFNLAGEVRTIVGIVKAGTSCASAIDVYLGNLNKARNALHHYWEGVVVVPCEEIHPAGLHFRSDRCDHIEAGFIRGTEVFKRRVMKILRIIIIEGAPSAKLSGTVFAVIWERYRAAICCAIRT